MKKSLILVGMLAVGYASAQEGSVGINTETPKATMEIVPSKTNLEGTTNEGIIIPKLTKARVLAIATDKLVEGTKVYITDEVLASDNAKFQGTGKGFYFYNGTKWVKQLDSDANTELWAQRDNAGVTETFLKPADADGNKYQYSNKGILSNLGKIIREDSRWVVSGDYGYTEGEVPNARLTSSDVLPLNSTIGNKTNLNVFKFGKSLNVIREAHAGQGRMAGKKVYFGQKYDIGAIDVTSNISAIKSLSGRAYAFTNSNTVGSVVAVDGEAIAGSVDHKTLKATSVIGGDFVARNFANTSSLVGVKATTHNYNNANTIIGGEFTITSSNQHIATDMQDPQVEVKEMMGVSVSLTPRANSTVGGSSVIRASSNYHGNSVSTGQSFGINARAYFQKDTSVQEYNGVYSYVRGIDTANVIDIYGFRFDNWFQNNFYPTNMYGLYLADVKRATDKNYAIYANAGQVRFGDLKGTGNRNVYVDADGVLKAGEATTTGATTVGNTDGIVCNADNVGKINYGDITLSDGRKVGAFGFCMKGTDTSNNLTYGWKYLYGIEGVTSGSGAFGSGIQ